MSNHPGADWIDANWESLPNNEWVAADGNGLVDHDPHIGPLTQRIQDKKLNAEDIAIAYITRDAVC